MALKNRLDGSHVFFREMPPEMEEQAAAVFAGYEKGYLFHPFGPFF